MRGLGRTLWVLWPARLPVLVLAASVGLAPMLAEAAPTITEVRPSAASEGMPVIIIGDGFSEIVTSNIVRIGGVQALASYPASPTVLVATVPAGAGAGTITVEVDGQTSPTFAFTVPSPPAGNLTDENAINLQTIEGTFSADLAIISTNGPHVQIQVDPDLAGGGSPQIAVYSITTNGTVSDITAQFSLTVPPYSDDADVTLGLGNNVILVTVETVSDSVSFDAAMLNFTPDTLGVLSATDPDLSTTDPGSGETFQSHTLTIDFDDTLTDRPISEFLQNELLRPVGLTQDIHTSGLPKFVTVDATLRTSGTGETVLDIVTLINSSPPPGVEGATVDVFEEDDITVGEIMPQRLTNGGPNGTGGGANNNAFNNANGGFDNDGSTVAGGDPDNVGVAGTPSDELNLFWEHFFVQTFAAHRLRDSIISAAGGGAAPAAGLAIADSGFGNGGAAAGANPVLNDLPLNRLGVGADPAVPPASFDGIDYTTGVRRPRQIALLADRVAGNGHGTYVALSAAGNGTRTVLGTGKDANVFIYRKGGSYQNTIRALNDAAGRADVDVVNLSASMRNGTPAQMAVRTAQYRVAVRALDLAGKVFVKSSGNSGGVAGTTSPAIPTNLAPGRGGRHAAGAFGRFIVVGATDIVNTTRGQERRWANSNRGNLVHVTAPGGARLIATRPDGRIRTTGGGTSWAAPRVAGLLAELIQVDETLNGVPAGAAALRARRLRMVETVEGTADDLGTLDAGAPHRNNDAGDGPDDDFGHGRINARKAMLSVVNGGLSAQHGRTAVGGNDSVFRSLPLIDDAATTWYGFEIVTSERQATVWIDGTQLTDAGAAMPQAPNITAYKGVRSDLRIERGVHNLTDGSGQDPFDWVVEEDPTSGIVAVGTRIDNRGQYVMTFSIQRSDLYDGANPRTLSLRRRGSGVNDRPIFNLRLETPKMRTGEVSGVSFDDFVFQIVPPDYGDAAMAPTLMNAENGARHENSNLEWLGKLDPADLATVTPNLKSVTPEHNADPEATGGDPSVDVDGVDNRLDFHDRDGRDDGVVFFPLTYFPGHVNGEVEFTVGVFDHLSPRYSADLDHGLYVNLWIDWDTDGAWEEGASGEHVINGLRLNPQNAGWIEDQGSSGSATGLDAVSADGDRARFWSLFDVPATIGCGRLWARMRLDYGENAGANDPSPHFDSLMSLGWPGGPVAGAARYGEVEDYLIGSDFGDAPDPFTAPGQYPTLKINDGARHLDIHQEWLGPDNNAEPNPSREIDADDPACAGGGGTDQDGGPNLDPADTDLRCDGVAIPPFAPGMIIFIDVTVTSSISARGAVQWVMNRGGGARADWDVGRPDDAADSLPRYDLGDPTRRLYLSGWADWNGDGIWDTPGEKIIDDILDPQWFGADGQYTLGEWFDDANMNGVYDTGETYSDAFGIDTQTFTYTVGVPAIIADAFWFRFRLAYGEDETTVDIPRKEADEENRNNNEDKGGALCGEVEDYPHTVIEFDYFPITEAVVTIESPVGTDAIELTGPGALEVDLAALDDRDNDTREEVPTELVELDLTGYSSLFGPVHVRLRPTDSAPFQPSTGWIEETTNDTPGLLDLPPFTTNGTADNSLDVFVEVEISGEVLHNEIPEYLETPVTYKPVTTGETFVSFADVALHLEDGTTTGFVLQSMRWTPIPSPTNVYGACCQFDGTCTPDSRPDTCMNLGGTWLGDGIPCVDMAAFEPCLYGPGVVIPGDCVDQDFDGDNHVDLYDYALMQQRVCATVPFGACCVDGVCVATNQQAQCADLGGDWHPGEQCPEFDCLGAFDTGAGVDPGGVSGVQPAFTGSR